MYTISKEFAFSSSHQLPHLPETHPCARIHGHNYIVKVELKARELNKDQFILDYRQLDNIKIYLDSFLDHRHLNDVLPILPTAENMAKYLYEKFKSTVPCLSAVEVSETPKTNARYEVG